MTCISCDVNLEGFRLFSLSLDCDEESRESYDGREKRVYLYIQTRLSTAKAHNLLRQTSHGRRTIIICTPAPAAFSRNAFHQLPPKNLKENLQVFTNSQKDVSRSARLWVCNRRPTLETNFAPLVTPEKPSTNPAFFRKHQC